MRYSFIIPTLNRPKDTSNLLEDIEKLVFDKDDIFEVVLFNDGNNLETADFAQNWQKYSLIYLFSKERVNSCISRNHCIEKATGDWLIFLDDDVRLDANFMMQVKRHQPNFKGFSFRMELPNKKDGGFLINHWLEKIAPGKILPFFGHFIAGFAKKYTDIKKVQHLPGANMIFARDVVGDIRFDEKIGSGNGYLDDADFSFSIKKSAKIDLAYISDYSIVHLQTPAGGNRQLNRQEWFYFYQSHKNYFFRKHFSPVYIPFAFFFNGLEALIRSFAYKTNLVSVFFKSFNNE